MGSKKETEAGGGGGRVRGDRGEIDWEEREERGETFLFGTVRVSVPGQCNIYLSSGRPKFCQRVLCAW